MLYKYICQSHEYTLLIELYTLHMLNINGLKLYKITNVSNDL